jgi:hypothetical protein
MTDFTPFCPNRNSGHEWCIILDNTGKNRCFQGLDVMENSYIGTPMSKVFRRCYAINPELLELNLSDKNVPALFRDIHIRDVTDEYCRTDDVTVRRCQKITFLIGSNNIVPFSVKFIFFKTYFLKFFD